MPKLPHTSETSISITFLVMNLSTILRQIVWIFCAYLKTSSFSLKLIGKNDILTIKNQLKLS